MNALRIAMKYTIGIAIILGGMAFCGVRLLISSTPEPVEIPGIEESVAAHFDADAMEEVAQVVGAPFDWELHVGAASSDGGVIEARIGLEPAVNNKERRDHLAEMIFPKLEALTEDPRIGKLMITFRCEGGSGVVASDFEETRERILHESP